MTDNKKKIKNFCQKGRTAEVTQYEKSQVSTGSTDDVLPWQGYQNGFNRWNRSWEISLDEYSNQ